MIKSMTGFGTAALSKENRKFTVEIKSVNHKYGDISIRLPRAMSAFEEPIRKIAAKTISRGKVDVFVVYESTAAEDNAITPDFALCDSVFNALTAIKERYTLNDSISVELLSRFPGVLSAPKAEDTRFTLDGELWQLLHATLNEAIQSFTAMRENEGAALKSDFLQKVDAIENNASAVEKLAPTVVADYKQRLEARIKILLSSPIDEQRLAHEVTLFADKCAIDEELTRLKSHLRQFRNILDETEPIGKKLDFLTQEILRETNTIGSKSNNLDITNNVLEMKATIEKIREQVQNVL